MAASIRAPSDGLLRRQIDERDGRRLALRRVHAE